ncbi:RagB/SusD family nutrient uptake outer membrane protein [Sphingobacterium yanglingense]|uniref:Putative outer membrane starch-binding protein n=1 Tax=Sphingobacterium yanglingense TaxID=1437280 RepID=A0A4R6W7H1_9SPHI|nr:RagB/SusD family nutrient uptake outer membrane protein [Sphingobacterium yanglingense]TDQ73466.1 putative outer membrane starch-binding protein [Sphingobacterium yanglingense]
MIKRIRQYTIVIVLVTITLVTGCKKNFFDTQPDNQLDIASIFSNREQTEQYWGGLFTAVPDIWDQPYAQLWGAISDELDISNNTDATINAINSGALTTSTTPQHYLNYYVKIRQCAIFLENIDRNQEILALDNGAELIKRYKAEARFLRAYYYWMMVKLYGPVVFQPETVGNPNDNYMIPRTPMDEGIARILSEMDKAYADLPEDYYQSNSAEVDPTQRGRINKMIIAAVKSQILLYHASPLYNGNTDYASFRNYDGTLLFNQVADQSRWGKAAAAAKAAIDLADKNGKSLYKVNHADPFRAAFLSSRDLYWNGWRTEGIWLRTTSALRNWEIRAAPRAIAGTAYNYTAPMQEVIDDFRMANGKDISQDPAYDETGYTTKGSEYYVAGTNNMYVGREARFYAYITFNGSMIPGAPKAGMSRVEFYSTGNSGSKGAPRDWTVTGYTVRKNIHNTFSVSPAVNVARPAMLIRLAELYLNYAEALNESDPGHPDVLKYLNAIRNRAGLSSLDATLSQHEIRESIRMERRIELSFEGHRYFDVRRWKVAGDPGYYQGGNYTGMDMSKGTTLSDPEFHTRTVVLKRTPWDKKYYFMPFGQAEMDRNTQLVPLPGY